MGVHPARCTSESAVEANSAWHRGAESQPSAANESILRVPDRHDGRGLQKANHEYGLNTVISNQQDSYSVSLHSFLQYFEQ